MSTDQQVKDFYSHFHDPMNENRYHSPYWIRRYAHRQILAQFLPFLHSGQHMLDAGCGEGMLCCQAAQKGLEVVGVDISAPNILTAEALARQSGVKVQFLQADVESLPFPDNSFDVVVSSHVLEHLPRISRGLQELYRVTRHLALIAMPTCVNPASWALFGGDRYWALGRRSLVAVPSGFCKMVRALVHGEEGLEEGYGDSKEMPHLWRFPWVMRREITAAGFLIRRFEAGPLLFPYLAEYIPLLRPLQKAVDHMRAFPVVRNFGIGSMAVCEKMEDRKRGV